MTINLNYQKMGKNRLLVLISSMFLMMILCSSCEKEEFRSDTYYWDGDEKVSIKPIENKSYVAYQTSDEDKLIAELSKNGLLVQTPNKLKN